MNSTVNDRQVGGAHYAAEVQHWDFAAAHFGRGYFKGQITKYVTRWRKKNGVQDLLKAQHFLEKLMSLGEPSHSLWTRILMWLLDIARPVPSPSVDEYLCANKLTWREAQVVQYVMADELMFAARVLRGMIRLAEISVEDDADATSTYVNQDPNHGG